VPTDLEFADDRLSPKAPSAPRQALDVRSSKVYKMLYDRWKRSEFSACEELWMPRSSDSVGVSRRGRNSKFARKRGESGEN
jgi:hypothetical protein